MKHMIDMTDAVNKEFDSPVYIFPAVYTKTDIQLATSTTNTE